MGKPFNSSLMPTADRSAWIFCARRFICTPQIVESLAYESWPRTSLIPDSRTSDRALSRSVVGPCAGSMAPGKRVGITPASLTEPAPAMAKIP